MEVFDHRTVISLKLDTSGWIVDRSFVVKNGGTKDEVIFLNLESHIYNDRQPGVNTKVSRTREDEILVKVYKEGKNECLPYFFRYLQP